MFKLELLRDVSALDYDIMIWLDVDTYFVRPFQNSFLDLTSQYPLFALLEDDLADPEFCFRNGGIDCKLAAEIRDHFRIPAFRHVNGGLFAIRRDQMSKVITLLRDVPRIFPAHIPPRDEHYLALASQILNASPPSLYDHLDQYALDVAGCPWPGERYGVTFGLGRRLPDGRPWHARKWSKQVKMLVDPAVVHVMNSKDALRRFGRSEELSARRVIGGGQPAV